MFRKKVIAVLLFCMIFMCALPVMAAAHKKGDPFYYKTGRQIATWKDKDTLVYIPPKGSDAPRYNFENLNYILGQKGKLELIIPKGSKLKINGALVPTSNKTIVATGATITMKPKTYVMFTDPNKKLHDITIKGGTFRSPDKGGRAGSMFQFAHAKNITLDGVNVNANFKGHAVEIIACSNVTVKNSTIFAIGKNTKDGKEEAIQIDVASKATAPRVAEKGAKWVKGQTCSNIKILNNKIYGARAVGVNYYAGFPDKYHKNIVIKGNKLHATTSEAIQFYNVIGGEISNNVIRTDATRQDSNRAYTIAVHMQNNGKGPAALETSKITVKGNTIYGNRACVYLKGHFTDASENVCDGECGTVEIRNNKVYCKSGEYAAIGMTRGSCRNWIVEDNETHVWDSFTKVKVDLSKLK